MSEEMIDQQINAAVEKWHATRTNLSMAVSSFTAVSLATHSPGGVFLGGCVAYVAGYYGDSIARNVRNVIPHELIEEVQRRLARRSNESKPKDTRVVEDDPHVYASEMAELQSDTLFDFGIEDDQVTLPSQQKGKKDMFRFSELLASGFVPSVRKIFVGRRADNGKDIFVSAEDLCHVALAGKTGGGKGSLMRLIMVQLCYIGTKVLLLNPHYMRWVVAKDGPDFDEDWTPIEGINPRTGKSFLEVPPVDCADFPPIEQYLVWTVQNLLQERKRAGREGGVRFKPYFIVLDEWPSIAEEIKGSPTLLSKLLREGRKYGIFVIVASQDFQVKTIGMDGGSVRKCLLTTYYTGGDKTTAKELLNMPLDAIAENEVGKGVVYLRCVGTDNEAVLVRVPFVDNESVYKLLGPSTHKRAGKQAIQQQESVAPVSAMPVAKLVLPQQSEQQIILTYADYMALTNGKTEILPEKQTDDLPAELPTNVIRSPYYTEVDGVVTYPPTRKSSSTLPPVLEAALNAYEPGMSYRELAARLDIGKDAAGKRIDELKRRKLI